MEATLTRVGLADYWTHPDRAVTLHPTVGEWKDIAYEAVEATADAARAHCRTGSLPVMDRVGRETRPPWPKPRRCMLHAGGGGRHPLHL